MPKVGEEEYGYGKEGREAAEREAKRTGRRVIKKKNPGYVVSHTVYTRIGSILSEKKKTGFVKAAKSSERRGTEGTFTEYCGGKVTDACIKKGLAAGGIWAKRAAFAKAAKSIAKNK